MARLSDILYKVSLRGVRGSTDIDVSDVVTDSRKATQGSCFIAVKGTLTDGHAFIPTAIANGATAIICEQIPSEITEGITYVQVDDAAAASGPLAHQFFREPSTKLRLVGVTGTNGKTTVATLLYQLFTGLGHMCGLVSTVKYMIGDRELPSTHTTPDAVTLNRLLHDMWREGCSHVFMECSSHAIHQHRINGLHFEGAIFTNITHDHLDYHKTFDEYIRVKKSFFDGLASEAFAITNLDDKRGSVMLQNTHASKYTYSLRTIADFKGRILDNALGGLHMLINEQEVSFRMIGEFNAYNLLAVYGAAVCLGEDRQEVLVVLSNLRGAEGRFEYMVSREEGIIGIVDYAHTPDALLNVLATIRNLRKGSERVITVVGCGGDRDRAKRPVMAEVAVEHSDKAIFTSDNPRSEDPQAILRDMEAGVVVENRNRFVSIADRREAIKAAVSMAGKEDIVLVAGKGHEKYQEIRGEKFPFDDKEILNECLSYR
jgi:UDP-N-acetylmuramoyl-L-alanyl-D-glutamate--2,6-diaminopimelate ligase